MMTDTIEKSSLHTVFSNSKGTLFQCDIEMKFHLVFKGEKYALRVCDFLKFKRYIQSIDLEAKLASPAPEDDLEIVFISGSDRCMLLDMEDLISLRDLLEGGMTMLQLNSILVEKLGNVSLVAEHC
ncbi:DUF6686 family protein [Aureibacter tunicatorum]|uniref:Uncharacterized protein n=1 Tax=Aureibacter tunicatorum TaxID=866807 RepID=A0AAE3XJT7_9BACT|nr:DUF6686 family protein [Aureibacter tunicatorum]MDR6237255.1 hypothetical protein [Aureibacter tunicatorum]BDD06247.1 hypothetical protein AUTU_37300 [Aureibacter tunicatorum]